MSAIFAKNKNKIVWIFVGILFLADVLILNFSYRRTGEYLEVSFLDVGQGDAIFVESPSGIQMLIDAGKPGTVMSLLSGIMSFSDKKIDILLLTHTDLDHNGGAPEVLERYEIGALILNKEYESKDDKPIVDLANENGVKIVYARRGQVLDLGAGAYATILFPDRNVEEVESNTGSIGLKLTYGDMDFVLTGDMPSSVEEYLVKIDKEYLSAEVLKLGHHGSKTSSSENFISAVSPQYAIVSAGADNTYGHPHKEVLDKLSGVKILETSKEGTITFVSDGRSLHIK